MQATLTLLDAALEYNRFGWEVVPLYPLYNGHCTCKAKDKCESPGKHPWISWADGVSKDPKDIRKWWEQKPTSGIGVLTGKRTGILLLDIDGQRGFESVKNLELPRTPKTKTGRGNHYLYQFPSVPLKSTTTAGILPGVDFRGDGGLFVAPPTLHISGNRYMWELPPDLCDLSPAPNWVVETFKEVPLPPKSKPATNGHAKHKAYAEAALAKELELLRSTMEGGRNNQLNKSSYSLGQLVGAGELTQTEVEYELENAASQIGLPMIEARKTIASGIDAGMKDPRIIPDQESKFFTFEAAAFYQNVDEETGEIEEIDEDLLDKFEPSDEGNAQAFMYLYGKDFLYNDAFGWMSWNGKFWEREHAQFKLHSKIVELLIKRRTVAVKNKVESVVKNSSPSSGRVAATIDMVRPKVICNHNKFDNDPDYINCNNGILNLRTGVLTEHNKKQRFTYCLETDYDPEADYSEWDKFLHEVLKGGDAIVNYVQMAIGYSITGYTNEECLFYPYGPTRSGKGTFTETLMRLFGKPLTHETDFNTFTAERNNDASNFDLAPLKPARMVFASESTRYRALNPAKIKQLTGGNEVYCCYKHKDFFNYRPQYKIFLSSNWPVNGDPDDDALWGRVRVIEFPNSFLGKEDKNLKIKFKRPDVLQGVLRWAVDGAMAWFGSPKGLVTPTQIIDSTAVHRSEADFVQMWLNECCEADEFTWTSNSDVMENYKQWCLRNGNEPKHSRSLSISLGLKGFKIGVVVRDGGAVARGVQGLKLKPVL